MPRSPEIREVKALNPAACFFHLDRYRALQIQNSISQTTSVHEVKSEETRVIYQL